LILAYNKNLKQYARELRKSMTDTENLLWSKIRGKQLKGCQFYRQKIIGNYIADFYCPGAKLVIELDGGQHYSSDGKEKDATRDAYIAGIGLKVLRFSDKDVFENLDGVIEKIWTQLS
jgi:very-short-patch-repair endonuclease